MHTDFIIYCNISFLLKRFLDGLREVDGQGRPLLDVICTFLFLPMYAKLMFFLYFVFVYYMNLDILGIWWASKGFVKSLVQAASSLKSRTYS